MLTNSHGDVTAAPIAANYVPTSTDFCGSNYANGLSIANYSDTRKTTSEMQQVGTYSGRAISAGWESYPSTANPSRLWGICSQANKGYPFFLWQYETDPCVLPIRNMRFGCSHLVR